MFNDYDYWIADIDKKWTFVGILLIIVSFISVMPQVLNLIELRTSRGISMFFCYLEVICHQFLLFNIICLSNQSIISFFQYGFFKTLPTLIPFYSVLFDCFLFQPIIFLCLIFYEEKEHNVDPKKRWKEIKLTLILNVLSVILLLVLFMFVLVFFGMNSIVMENFGGLLGILSALIEIFEYLPQIITTLVSKDSGSLSLVMLSIQSPVSLLFSFYMWYGLGEHWTTVISVIIDGSSQLILLIICLWFKFSKTSEKTSINLSEVGPIILSPILLNDEENFY